MPTFRHRSELPHSPEHVFAWHLRPGALTRLTPRYEDVEVVERTGGIADGGTIVLAVRKAGMRVRWRLRHTEFEPDALFTDEQVSGPFAHWKHRHLFRPSDSGGTVVEDEIEWEPPLGALGELMGGGAAERELTRLFTFRHERLRNDLARHAAAPPSPAPLTVAITGASGLVGTALEAFLTSGGHRVIRLVRGSSAPDEPEVVWDYRGEVIDKAGLEGADAIVHLAGESLIEGRWDARRKRAIRESRVRGTSFLSRSLADMTRRPRVMISASAVGYYGARGNERIFEDSSPGKGFLADVCKEWEAATEPAARAGIRVVKLRISPVISGSGGVLEPMLLPFKMGAGGRVASGQQYMSWIDHDDLIGLIHHLLVHPSVRGPVNAVSPHPVTNATFTSTLGRVLGRPTVLPIPGLAMRAVFGEKANMLLEGARVLPKVAQKNGFTFYYPGLEESLRFQLGKPA